MLITCYKRQSVANNYNYSLKGLPMPHITSKDNLPQSLRRNSLLSGKVRSTLMKCMIGLRLWMGYGHGFHLGYNLTAVLRAVAVGWACSSTRREGLLAWTNLPWSGLAQPAVGAPRGKNVPTSLTLHFTLHLASHSPKTLCVCRCVPVCMCRCMYCACTCVRVCLCV